MKGRGVLIDVGAVGIQVDAEFDQPGERLCLAIESGEDESDLLVLGACCLSEARDVVPTSQAKRGRQRQPGPPLNETFGSSEMAVDEGILRNAVGSSAGVDQRIDDSDLYLALARDP